MLCKCRTYAVISKCRTAKNPNRLFFCSPHFKEKQGYCDFFLYGLMRFLVESRRLASMETCVGEEVGAGLDYCLEERVKQLEEMLIKRNEDSLKLKNDSVLRLFSSEIIGALVVVILFCIYVVVI
ncbi:hypothetical protein Ahy_A10g049375 [Arachis hypogaea]|uniref:Uncharacterized protein n=1 Tax=Arachis hypogaea TaxID=3818 RepID=A0A445B719_ARAHY|nr:hypothetical protein Ahy_A10g049375 [Arachis hypogaea]